MTEMVQGLDNLRNYIQSLGWMDEGGEEQARDILTNLSGLSTAVFVATAKKYPEIFMETNGVPFEALEKLIDTFGDPTDRPTN